MSFQSQLQSLSLRKNTPTIITTKDGTKYIEKILENGEIVKEKIEGEKTAGFVVDTKPDKEVHRVIENLFVGSQDAAMNEEALKSKNITHVLNVATGISYAHIDGITFCTIEILDLPETNLINYFPRIFAFIEKGMTAGGILVHCNAGVSRSVSSIIGYLMSKGKTYQEAYDLVKKARPSAQPNDGFKKQLMAYEANFQNIPDDLKSKNDHKLQTAWTFWFEKKTKNPEIKEGLRKLGTFDTIEGFWNHYLYLQRPENVPIDHNYICFREIVVPMWGSIPEGSCWLVKLDKKSTMLTKIWEQMLFAAIGEVFGTPNVVGVILSIRAQENYVSVWTKDGNNPLNFFKLGEKLKRLLDVDPETMVPLQNSNTVIL